MAHAACRWHIHPTFAKLTSALRCGVWFSVALVTPTFATDIFSSVDANGTQKWATQALTQNYTHAISVADAPTAPSLRVAPAATNPQPVRDAGLRSRRAALYPAVEAASKRVNIDCDMVLALIEVESRFNPLAVSPRGARGLMQLMPATAARYGMRTAAELFNPEKNLDIGTRYLSDLLAMHGGHWALALASFNAGEGAVAKSGQRIPRYPETMLYVPAVMVRGAPPTVDVVGHLGELHPSAE
jgi:soluble lytic murein transglycosylase-like protein